MPMRKRFAAAAIICAVATPAVGAEGPGLGQPIAPAELAPWDISIGPDGGGLPPGRGTVAQGDRKSVV